LTAASDPKISPSKSCPLRMTRLCALLARLGMTRSAVSERRTSSPSSSNSCESQFPTRPLVSNYVQTRSCQMIGMTWSGGLGARPVVRLGKRHPTKPSARVRHGGLSRPSVPLWRHVLSAPSMHCVRSIAGARHS